MSRRTALFFASVGVAAAAGCYTGPSSDLAPAVHGPTPSIDGAEPLGNQEGAPEGGLAAATGIPCDVAKVLATSCTDCHGAKPSGGAPNPLVTYEDLKAPSRSDPAETVAAASVARLKATKRPMPPDGPLAPGDVAILERWVTDGMPRGGCGSSPATPDGGPGNAGHPAPKDAAADAASVCTSGVTFPANGDKDALMHPGKKCLGCHAAAGAKTFAMAGTVYPTLHEPNDCNGISKPNLSVLVIDALGMSHSIPVNAAGNFTRVTSITMPYRAMIVDGNKVREMKTPQTDGDCNGCHTEQGAGSPGRVMAP